ncbi:MAG: TonB-dependent receptor, partial [Muribaculaceae bacterium]|nr:TonB-dependent receptor [Muribaculaceae bacterium]
ANNKGIVETSGMERVTAGFNLSPKFFQDHLSVNANVQGTYVKTREADLGALGSALTMDPTKPVKVDYNTVNGAGERIAPIWNGYYIFAPGGPINRDAAMNPVATIFDKNNQHKTFSSTGNLQLDYSLHCLPELHFNLNLGYQVSRNYQYERTAQNSLHTWLDGRLAGNDALGASLLRHWYEVQRNTMLSFYANYKKDFKAIKSNLDVMAGYDWQRFSYYGRSSTRVSSLGYNNFSYADGVYTVTPSATDAIGELAGNIADSPWGSAHGPQYALVSFYGRLNYMFDDTYMLTFTLRDDGVSRFSKENRWALFPSLALGWKINNLPGLRDSDVLNEWKLRLGWGQTGQQDIGGNYWPYLPLYTSSVNGGFQYVDENGNWINPLYPNAYDANLKWETTTTWNVGMDFSFLNNRITANLDWYLRNTTDLLARGPVKGMNTSDFLVTNIGSLRNYGIEFNLGTKPVVTSDVVWTSNLNIAWNRNKITKLTGSGSMQPNTDRGVGSIGMYAQYYIQGEAANTYRVYQQVYDNDGNPVLGLYVDQNGDGQITDADLINFHSPEPKVTFNWQNNVNFRNWDFGIVFRAAVGNWVYNMNEQSRTNIATVDRYGLNNVLNTGFYFNNSEQAFPLSDYFVQNASFIRCDNITVGYTWDNLLNNNLRLRLYGACQNPFVITKYKGLDPEVFSGIDNNVYPRP